MAKMSKLPEVLYLRRNGEWHSYTLDEFKPGERVGVYMLVKEGTVALDVQADKIVAAKPIEYKESAQ